ncbi:hypothetical protein LNP74_32615 [Klebsiella pneumoniae subsp. pneumoniae]|nr:hypothetical protein [Klebsiella pneumoniae subsp. pneumoniae]
MELPGLAGDEWRAVPDPAGRQQYLPKHAPNVMGSARLLGAKFAAAGLPDGV